MQQGYCTTEQQPFWTVVIGKCKALQLILRSKNIREKGWHYCKMVMFEVEWLVVVWALTHKSSIGALASRRHFNSEIHV